jgi:hypothetical protein
MDGRSIARFMDERVAKETEYRQATVGSLCSIYEDIEENKVLT